MHGTERLGRTMYEELVGDLRYCAKGDCNGCRRYTKDTRYCNDLLCDAADAIEELSKKRDAACWGCKCSKIERNEWIPVTERLPEKYVNVLCHLRSLDRKSEYYSIDHLMEDGQWWKAANSWKHEVTHWMPLPEPPKEET